MKKKTLTCSQCGAPLHSNKCEYCGTEYETDFIELKCVNYTQPVETLKAVVQVPCEVLYREKQTEFMANYIKQELAHEFGQKLCDYMEVETWLDPEALTQNFGAIVRVGVPRK